MSWGSKEDGSSEIWAYGGVHNACGCNTRVISEELLSTSPPGVSLYPCLFPSWESTLYPVPSPLTFQSMVRRIGYRILRAPSTVRCRTNTEGTRTPGLWLIVLGCFNTGKVVMIVGCVGGSGAQQAWCAQYAVRSQ